MFYLIYVSTAAPEISDTDLREILATSRRKNAALGITGLLLFKQGRFMQLLEAEEEFTVSTLLETIIADPRHHDVIVLQRNQLPGRIFPDWAMAFRRIGESVPPGKDPANDLETAEIEFSSDALSHHSNRAVELLNFFQKHL